MIKNAKQLTVTKKRLEELKQSLEHIRKKYIGNNKKSKFLSKGVLEHIGQLSDQIMEYDKIKYGAIPEKLHADNLFEIRNQIIKVRIAKGITQVQLATKLGVPQSEISRFEREDYEGYSVRMLERILEALNTEVEVDLIPAHK
ncbi:MAG: helix-turn-helix transcriptional regulator [bacterium]